ncbi:MAG TPA: UDP-N-acetylmuramoyl-L-alanyl-D-glutamate--2,6-diaminopimelate ligase [Clostridia bacterium]|nr:UDP-N-acetylmuramoyl-L-alanyl-D-glutamate--2,6-diaminopimelate ligase [Clostridia bacterium]HPQ45777.1 UDP-N-acetylmuramoyl-L-alanyl-D-glutamate--2,6-diaminopimelate ligase [Clostridia bacterium]HRX41686.1 UDP-N-acetylmuramoyl-L-alanyl-D-glutamate--2,6-diaminopimelate ligase [Clostridia bacterium]
MKLRDVLRGVDHRIPAGEPDIDITGIAYDSRKVQEGFLFVCIDGVEDDGHKYLGKAWDNGAAAAIVTKEVDDMRGVVVMTTDARKALAGCAVNFYRNPSHELNLIGITGTKGKTTTSFMIKTILQEAKGDCAIMGNLGITFGDVHIDTSQNTPQSSDLQKVLRQMVDSGVKDCVMEVTSMGLSQLRTGYTKFSTAMFTNISRAHIGKREHTDFDEYLASKAILFSMCKDAIVNIDDEHAGYIIENAKCPVGTLSAKSDADIMATDIKISGTGSEFTFNGLGHKFNIVVDMPGMFNVYNALFAAASSIIAGADEMSVRNGIRNVVVPGRCERVPIDRNFSIMIDYAHSPDSLEKLLEAMKEFADGRVISVFGCGGDRDATMRPMMGEISGNNADFTIITSDNPRFEDPEKITSQIEEGMKKTNGEYVVIVDRTKAIEYAIKNARENDLIILAGKGHETYLDKMGSKTHYDEREIVAELLGKDIKA